MLTYKAWAALILAHLLFTLLDAGLVLSTSLDDWSIVNSVYKIYGVRSEDGASMGQLILSPSFYASIFGRVAAWDYAVLDHAPVGVVIRGALSITTVVALVGAIGGSLAGSLGRVIR